MKKQSKKNLKIISATAASLFSLVAVFTATIAWFALNNKVDGNGMTIRVKESGKSYLSGLTIHKCVTSESMSTMHTFYYVSASDEECVIDNYSQLNQSQPIFLLFPMGVITNNEPAGVAASEIVLTATSTSTDGYADVDTSNNKAPNYFRSFPFSSACTFRVMAWTSNVPTNSETEPTRYYVNYSYSNIVDEEETAPAKPYYVSNIQSFVTPNTESYDSLDWKGSNFTLFDGSALDDPTSNIRYLGVIIDYYPTALSCIFRAGAYSGDLTFNMDFSLTIS